MIFTITTNFQNNFSSCKFIYNFHFLVITTSTTTSSKKKNFCLWSEIFDGLDISDELKLEVITYFNDRCTPAEFLKFPDPLIETVCFDAGIEGWVVT